MWHCHAPSCAPFFCPRPLLKSALNDPQQRPTFATAAAAAPATAPKVPHSLSPAPCYPLVQTPPPCVGSPFFRFFPLCFFLLFSLPCLALLCVHLSFDNVFVFLCRFRCAFSSLFPGWWRLPTFSLSSAAGKSFFPRLHQISIRLIKDEIQVNGFKSKDKWKWHRNEVFNCVNRFYNLNLFNFD